MNKVSIMQKFTIIARPIRETGQNNSIKKKMNSFSRFSTSYAIILIAIIMASCTGGSKQTLKETPTRGNIRIAVDESFQPLIDTEIYTFTSLYDNATITPLYKPEYDVINDFMNDSVRLMATSKKLSDYQVQYLRDTLIIARTTTFAYDALALVTNKQNTDTLMKYHTVRDIFLGNLTMWNEINPKSKLGGIRVIFDNARSGNIRYFKKCWQK